MSNAEHAIKKAVNVVKTDYDKTYGYLQSQTAAAANGVASSRQRLMNTAKAYASTFWAYYLQLWEKHPFVTAFLTVEASLAAIPLAIFVGFVLALTIGATATAAAFVGFWSVVAGAILLGTLAATSFVGLFIYASLLSSFIFISWARCVYLEMGPIAGTMRFLGYSQTDRTRVQHYQQRAYQTVKEAPGVAAGKAKETVGEARENVKDTVERTAEGAKNKVYGAGNAAASATEHVKHTGSMLMQDMVPEHAGGANTSAPTLPAYSIAANGSQQKGHGNGMGLIIEMVGPEVGAAGKPSAVLPGFMPGVDGLHGVEQKPMAA
ncbi:hypothetical protein SAICODRAFT_70227 [Saitoella complicata NRRL Y-17804]|uniref:uncharacterized protein n=1 Tax=Saitoella complicata (strain BCRC 22490 / CBS 7301 / JCM 7358 / NBRC 10748 / NRRL Y-17804) TaxID=698492 RepID=UPI000867D8E1|nr:uncharacterized protein SAICODRAFT_70227 [Saitoella complicata NRRL Y-17804]ODQ54521.1 hypothetical protein SAICODRAFT_70227 [Saitoella complicata NRRL Y-17804]